MASVRQYPAIDLMKLYATHTASTWNTFLTERRQKKDISGLVKVRYGLQAGMADLVRKKLNSEKMELYFIRLQRSVENTIRDIFRERNPNPCDNPLIAKSNLEFQAEKRARDHLLELEIKKTGY